MIQMRIYTGEDERVAVPCRLVTVKGTAEGRMLKEDSSGQRKCRIQSLPT